MRRFHIKANMAVAMFFVAVIISIVTIDLGFNIALRESKGVLTQSLSKYFQTQIQIEDVDVFFPHSLVLKNLSILDLRQGSREEYISVPKVVLRFSLWRTILNRYLCLSRVELIDPQVYSARFFYKLKQEWPKIEQLIALCPKMKLNWEVKKAKIDLNTITRREDYLNADLSFYIDDDRLISYGAVEHLDGSASDQPQTVEEAVARPVRYDLSGKNTAQGFILDQLNVTHDKMLLKLWGDHQGEQTEVKGFCVINPKDDVSHYLVDIDSSLKMTKDELYVQGLGFNFNHMPVFLRGGVAFNEGMDFDFLVSMYPGRSKIKDLEQIRKMSFVARGNILRSLMKADGSLNVYFVDGVKKPLAIENIRCDFRQLVADFSRKDESRFALDKFDFSVLLDQRRYQTSMENFKAEVKTSPNDLKSVDFQALVSKGDVEGQVSLQGPDLPGDLKAHLVTKDVDMKTFNDAGGSIPELSGRFSSDLTMSNRPDWSVNGRVDLQEGKISDMKFLKDLAAYLDLPSMSEIAFHRLGADVAFDQDLLNVNHVSLNGENLNLNGDFQLKNGELILSKFSLGLTRELMRESSHFKSIVNMFEQQKEEFVFDFQLTGSVRAVNFEWMSSELKTKIQARLPNFIENIIERKVQGSI